MKPTDIPNNLATLNFILAKKSKDAFRLDYEDAELYYFPENEKHPDDVVKWLIGILKYRAAGRKITIYTFSETLINYCALLVNTGKLPVNFIKIFLLSEGENLDKAPKGEYYVSTVNSDGTLENWPFGWLMAGDSYNIGFRKDLKFPQD